MIFFATLKIQNASQICRSICFSGCVDSSQHAFLGTYLHQAINLRILLIFQILLSVCGTFALSLAKSSVSNWIRTYLMIYRIDHGVPIYRKCIIM